MLQKGTSTLTTVFLITVLLVASSIAYWFGANGYRIPFTSTTDFPETKDKDEKIRLLEKSIRQLKHDVAYMERSTKVELAAVEEMKKTLQEKDLELLKLNQELHFYRTLYSSDSSSSAINVKVFNLQKDLVADKFVYELVLTGVPKKDKKSSGVIGLSVDGEQQGILKRLVFEDIEYISETSLKFSFKYFQKISGSFSLPEDFEPSEVRIELLKDNAKKGPIVVSYNWEDIYKESNS